MCSVTGTCMSFNNTCNIAEMSNGACLSIICEKSLASARLVDFQCLKSGRRQQLVRTMLKLVVKLHASRMTRAVTFNSQQFARFRRTGLAGGRVKAATAHPSNFTVMLRFYDAHSCHPKTSHPNTSLPAPRDGTHCELSQKKNS